MVPNTTNTSIPNYNKHYFCQRCLNHDEYYNRKGHKVHCKYMQCSCEQCSMVEQRRQLNNIISKMRVVEYKAEIVNGKKKRDPKCGKCMSHGIFVNTKGHSSQCKYKHCKCEGCELVESRRRVMSKQIKLRREQHRHRQIGTSSSSTSNNQSINQSIDTIDNCRPRPGSVDTVVSSSYSNESMTPPPPLVIPIPTRPLIHTMDIPLYSFNTPLPSPQPLSPLINPFIDPVTLLQIIQFLNGNPLIH